MNYDKGQTRKSEKGEGKKNQIRSMRNYIAASQPKWSNKFDVPWTR